MRMMDVPNWLPLNSCNFKRSQSEENENPPFWQRQSYPGMAIKSTNSFVLISLTRNPKTISRTLFHDLHKPVFSLSV